MRALLLVLLSTGCASTLPRSGLSCPSGAEVKTSDDGERGFREWCEIPSGERDCVHYVGCEVPGTAHGPAVRWHANGTRAEESRIVHGKLVGRKYGWYPSGKLELVWEEFQPDQVLEARFHESGRMALMGTRRSIRRESVWSGWFDNGQPAFSGAYEKGVPVGPWRFWSRDGALSRVEDFGDQLTVPFVGSIGQDPHKRNGRFTQRAWLDVPVTSGFYIDGVKHGAFWTFDDQGVLKTADVYERDQLISHWSRP